MAKQRGGARPGAGRPTDRVKHLFETMLEESGAHKRAKLILKMTPDEDKFIRLYNLCLDRAHGKAAQPLEHTGKDGEPLNIQIIKYGEAA